jgi:Ca2+/H+ antiporter
MAPPPSAGRLVAKLAIAVALFILVLLVPAGTWRWPEAWVFLALYLAFAVPVGVWLFRANPELLAQRSTGRGGPRRRGTGS